MNGHIVHRLEPQPEPSADLSPPTSATSARASMSRWVGAQPRWPFRCSPARRLWSGLVWVDDAGMSVATVVTEPARHALVMPDCECGTCGPTWARRRGKARRFTEPVTLVAALEKEDAAAWPGMVEQHRACLAEMVDAADDVIAATPRDDPGRPGVGLALVLFAGELA